MSAVNAGVVALAGSELDHMVQLAKGEKVTQLAVNRRMNPIQVEVSTSEGRGRHVLQLSYIARMLSLPPVHSIHDLWFTNGKVHLVIYGQQMPRVEHGKPIPDVQMEQERIERAGIPEHIRTTFKAA